MKIKSTRFCAFPDCMLPLAGLGLCTGHYQQSRRGSTLKPLVGRSLTLGMTDQERFNFYVDKSGDCWVWTGALGPRGYGQFRYDGATRRAHRVAYMLAYGPLTQAQTVDHRCRNTSCVRPEHLRIVTQKQNCENRGLARHNKSGHSNVFWLPKSEKWRVQLMHNRKLYRFGDFSDIEEAAEVARQARLQLFTHSDGR